MKIINRRNIILLIGLVLCILLFIYTDARYTAYIAILLVLMFIGALVCILVTGKEISVEASGPVQGSRGNPSGITISVLSKSIIPVIMCTITVSVINRLTGEKDSEKYSFCVRKKKPKRIKTVIHPKYCGCLTVSVGNIEVSDPLRLFVKKTNISEETDIGLCNIYYMPEAIETYISPDDVSAYNMESYKYSALSKGNDPAETFDIKTYETGDSYKAIHWKLSSKTDDLVIREFGLPVENNVLLLLDKNRGRLAPEECDRETEFAASLSYTLLHKEVNHTIGWYNLDSGTFEMEKIDSIDSFWTAMKGIISSPFGEDTLSAVDRYIESDTEKEYSAYGLVSSQGDDIEKLMAYGQVDLYRPEDYR